nr:hypothetical protein [Tanacetum cinerariifolium]
MENIEEQVETLTKLMASLDIPSEANDEDAESLDELKQSRIATTDAMTTFNNVVARIVQEFTGGIPGVEALLIQKPIAATLGCGASVILGRDPVSGINPARQKAALEMFFNKLPESVSSKLKDMYNTLLQDGTRIQDTLGARITTLKAWMRKECLQETAKKEAQVKLCYEMQSDKI